MQSLRNIESPYRVFQRKLSGQRNVSRRGLHPDKGLEPNYKPSLIKPLVMGIGVNMFHIA